MQLLDVWKHFGSHGQSIVTASLTTTLNNSQPKKRVNILATLDTQQTSMTIETESLLIVLVAAFLMLLCFFVLLLVIKCRQRHTFVDHIELGASSHEGEDTVAELAQFFGQPLVKQESQLRRSERLSSKETV